MDRLQTLAEEIKQQRNPPVHLWHPETVGEIDICIDSQGFWFHEGAPIERLELVKLFASILWFENDQHYLVTPVEKLAITVADSAFVIQQMEHVDDTWMAVTNLSEQLFVGEQHPVELRVYSGQLIPYIKVRYELWARVNRSIYYQWVTAAMEQQGENFDKQASLMLSSGDYQFRVAEPLD